MSSQRLRDRRIGLVVSPNARCARRMLRSGRPFWRDLLPESQVRSAANQSELDDSIAAFEHHGIGTIAGLGGDGSLRHLVEAIVRRNPDGGAPHVLALAGGTMNGIARSLGTGGPPDRCLQRVMAQRESGTSASWMRPMLRVAHTNSTTAQHAFSLASGVVCRAYEKYYRRAEPGLRDAVSATLEPVRAAIFGGGFFQGVVLDVEADGERWMAGAHTLVASVLDDPVLWFRPFGSPPDNRSTFNLVATSLPPRQLALRFGSLCRGRYRHPDIRIGQVSHADVTVRGDVGFLLDGDLQPRSVDGALRLQLSLGPAISFLVPPSGRRGRLVAEPTSER